MTYQEDPFKRLAVYTRRSQHGGVNVDTEAMMTDIITVFKAGGLPIAALQQAINETWPLVGVQVGVPDQIKN